MICSILNVCIYGFQKDQSNFSTIVKVCPKEQHAWYIGYPWTYILGIPERIWAHFVNCFSVKN